MGVRWLEGQRPMLFSFGMELGPGGWNWGLEAWIRALRVGFELRGWDFSFKAEI